MCWMEDAVRRLIEALLKDDYGVLGGTPMGLTGWVLMVCRIYLRKCPAGLRFFSEY